MSLPLRITYRGKDYTYTILTKLISKDTKEIKISLNNEELTLVQNQKKEWQIIERTIADEGGLIEAIARTVSLRYRL
ncbi:hypothetical protein ABDJ41_18870 [Pedobacter sp. ASV1-7]|uniref:hypothetical protein n=1 Tax=Pedobacter sp. ASV1-7 TaxID=3145237 RepID=UPI0032E8BD72